jgi:hypothetical protein
MLKMLVSAILFCGPLAIAWGHNDHHGQPPVILSAEAAVTDAVNGTAGSGLVVDFRSNTERTPGSVSPRPGIQPLTGTQKVTVSGSQRVMVLRVYFADYANTSRFSQTQVNGFFDQLNTLWKNTSYNSMIKFLEFDKIDKNGVAESAASAPDSAQPKRSRR